PQPAGPPSPPAAQRVVEGASHARHTDPRKASFKRHRGEIASQFVVETTNALKKLLATPNVASKRYAHRQYDSTVQGNTVFGPGSGAAAVLRVEGTAKGLALTTDCNPRYTRLDPRLGAQQAVAEAARNLACVGAEPIAVTDCLNFGNPEKPGAA